MYQNAIVAVLIFAVKQFQTLRWNFSLMGIKRCEILGSTHIFFSAKFVFVWVPYQLGSYVLTCKTLNINVALTPVGFVPEFNCCGINFCRQTNPNFAWKIQLYGYQKMGNLFWAQHWYIFRCKICVRLTTISLFFAERSYVLTCKTFNINVAASPVEFVP